MNLYASQQYLFRSAAGGWHSLARTASATDSTEATVTALLNAHPFHAAPPCRTGQLSVWTVLPNWVAVIRHQPCPPDAASPQPMLHVLLISNEAYGLIGHPFALADYASVDWAARGEYPELNLEPFLVPHPQTNEVLAALQEADTPLIYGAVQALLDGARLQLVESETCEPLLRQMWPLLPYNTRANLRLATGWPGWHSGFHLLATPTVPTEWPESVLTAEQLRNYPEGKYEHAMQLAIETGQQADYEQLLRRRSGTKTLKLALVILLVVMALSVLFSLKF